MVYQQLVETSERVSSDSKAKAKGFLAMLKSRDVLSFLLFMVDVLSPLKYLSLMLQEEKAILANQHQAIECTIEAIMKLKSRYLTYQTRKKRHIFSLNCFLIVFLHCFTSDGPSLRKIDNKDTYQGIQLSKERIFKFSKVSMLNEVIQQFSKRFSDFCTESTVVKATRIADVKTWPRDWESLKGNRS